MSHTVAWLKLFTVWIQRTWLAGTQAAVWMSPRWPTCLVLPGRLMVKQTLAFLRLATIS